MSKEASRWYSERLRRQVKVVRWGEEGTPLLLFPTAGGDAEECERFLMIDALAPFLADRRLKVYSVDSVAGEAWLDSSCPTPLAAQIQNRYDAFVYEEVVPAIRTDCRTPGIETLVGGASLGAYNALASLCRHPDVFSRAICMSGTYDLSKFSRGEQTHDFYLASPLRFLPDLEGEWLERLRSRFVLLTHGQGRWEEPAQSWRVAEALGQMGVPNRVDAWDGSWDHDWPTWRSMLPRYLGELLP